MMNDHKIGVVIVTYNSENWIKNCLDSLADSSLTADIVVVADNNSSDNTADCINDYENVKLIQIGSNKGFGIANNIGARYCIDHGCNWLLLLNPDAKVRADSIQVALETIKSSDNIGIVGGVELEYYSDVESRYTAMHAYEATKSDKILQVNGTKGQSINGAFLFISVRTIKTIGLFDPIYHLYFEESDLIRRFRFAGYSVQLNPKIKYHHYISASFDNMSTSNKYMSANKLKAITLSESIHRLTNPERHFIVNIVSFIKQILLIIWNYKLNIKLMMLALVVIATVPINKCIDKWKMDRSRNFKYYLDLIID